MPSQFLRVGAADDLVERVFDDADGKTCRDVFDAGAVFLRLLDGAVHEDRAAAAEIGRRVGK